jgi:methylated-DNA-[protein]-cysteine S-methyltransferase
MSTFAASTASPVGRLVVTASEEAILAIGWSGKEREEPPPPLLAEALRQIGAYFAGRLTRFDLPLDPKGSAFEERVWSAMREIPYGKIATYGAIAGRLGSSPRAVGGACGRNPIAIVIPCHRVVGRFALGGYSGGEGPPTKEWLLAFERAADRVPARTGR